MVPERCQPVCHCDKANSAVFRRGEFATVIGVAHADPISTEVHVVPTHCHHFAGSQPGVSAEQHGEISTGVYTSRGFDEPFVLIEVEETGLRSERSSRRRDP